MSKILVIGDMHLKDHLGYSEYIEGGRQNEKDEVLELIVNQSRDCDYVVFLGDLFNSKNNSSEVNRQVVQFLERFDTDIYIISGNHEKKGDGTTALDFLKEVTNKGWKIYSDIEKIKLFGKEICFLPNMLNSELGVNNRDDAVEEILKRIGTGDILFAHHAISGTTFNGIKTEILSEVVLPKEVLEKNFKLVVGGHIHDPQEVGRTVIAGSSFTNQVGEVERFIWKINDDLSVEKINLPCREIHKIENPTIESLSKIKKDSIVKAILTKKGGMDIDDLKKELSKFDAYLLIENYPSKRKKAHIEEGAFDFSIEALLELYAKEKKVDAKLLLKGLELIK